MKRMKRLLGSFLWWISLFIELCIFSKDQRVPLVRQKAIRKIQLGGDVPTTGIKYR